MSYSFSGHETFTCKNYWLKKGYDHSIQGKKFNDDAVIDLGVGKNMVNSISFWLKAFGLSDNDVVIDQLIFDSSKGYDPYLEDIGTIWFLHHLLVTTEKATIYNLVFNYFRKLRIEFNIPQLIKFIEDECDSIGQSYSSNSLKKDAMVFVNNYTKNRTAKSLEDQFNGMLYELKLVEFLGKKSGQDTYRIESNRRKSLPSEILLASHLFFKGVGSFSFSDLLNGKNQVGSVFALNSDGLSTKIKELEELYPKHIRYSDTAGVQTLQIKESIDFKTVLNRYYEQ
jgi:hypothetical protein